MLSTLFLWNALLCCAVGCFNRAEKGFLMKYFPKNPQRPKEWVTKMKRKDWMPTDCSVLKIYLVLLEQNK